MRHRLIWVMLSPLILILNGYGNPTLPSVKPTLDISQSNHWTPINFGSGHSFYVKDPQGLVYYASDAGLFAQKNNGLYFIPNSELIGKINQIVFDKSNVMYLATSQGIYTYQNSTFKQLSNSETRSLGFDSDNHLVAYMPKPISSNVSDGRIGGFVLPTYVPYVYVNQQWKPFTGKVITQDDVITSEKIFNDGLSGIVADEKAPLIKMGTQDNPGIWELVQNQWKNISTTNVSKAVWSPTGILTVSDGHDLEFYQNGHWQETKPSYPSSIIDFGYNTKGTLYVLAEQTHPLPPTTPSMDSRVIFSYQNSSWANIPLPKTARWIDYIAVAKNGGIDATWSNSKQQGFVSSYYDKTWHTIGPVRNQTASLQVDDQGSVLASIGSYSNNVSGIYEYYNGNEKLYISNAPFNHTGVYWIYFKLFNDGRILAHFMDNQGFHLYIYENGAWSNLNFPLYLMSPAVLDNITLNQNTVYVTVGDVVYTRSL